MTTQFKSCKHEYKEPVRNMKIYPPTQENIKKAASIIAGGGIVSFPTETVYGLGSDAFNPIAVSRIFEAKKRPFFDPLIVHINRIEQLHRVSLNTDSRCDRLAEKFWPGPLTLVLEKAGDIPDIVTSGLPTVAVRMPDHPVASALISESGTCITAPSANPFGYLSPTRAEHVRDQLGDRIDMILDGGECRVGVESTIIKLDKNDTILLRPGGITVEEIEDVTGRVTVPESISDIPDSPGRLPFHYSPTTPLVIVDSIEDLDFSRDDAGFLMLVHPGTDFPEKRVEILSSAGDMREAAARLFSCLHRLDRLGLKVIYAQSVPEQGLGMAIMDRLRKASEK